MRRGVWLIVLGLSVAALAAASARADGTTTTGTTAATTTATTATTTAPVYARLTPSFLPNGCVGAGAAAIAEPGRRVLTLGTPASGRGPSAYPAKATLFAFGSSTGGGSTCRSGRVSLQSVSLLDGVVTATGVEATAGKGTVSGLAIQGTPTTLAGGETIAIGNWAQLTLGKRIGRLAAPLVLVLLAPHKSLPAGTVVAVAFAAHARPVTEPRPQHHSSSGTNSGGQKGPATGSLQPAQPQQQTAKHRHRKRHKPAPKPLTVTPPLGFRPSHYVFPVDTGASYGDTYGANRNDIYDGWHHGDDLFAPLGTPVVAVANGKLSLVGWNRLGGWRLWLTDGDGNSFYYAHLAGYSRWILDHPNVRAGQVVGFLGRTGDAFTTAPHLHFEIHPHQFLKLKYDGAVDPTAYLEKWRVVHVPPKEMPQPAKLKAPRGTPAQEASVVWHELLVARHLLSQTSSTAGAGARGGPSSHSTRAAGAAEQPLRMADVQAAAAHVPANRSDAPWMVGAPAGAAMVVLFAGAFAFRRRRRTTDDTSS
jgi:murein DD-endopeptidase MepM/ murein hydrolase activator NlpD